ncbi:type II toxin-antitoxin system VapC family toxin [Glycomyces arizonensis]|uniref:type II toxin-antitoxin system VapC family toxin n=1 Tax=Glycomyces arizonensis TaxID=256035 RepID=UPI0003FF5027|nr:type II toxin-antitoxin system VapC family toxin [Glycomyces arizonensis]
MIVLDNSALVDALTVDSASEALLDELVGQDLHIPHLLDYEFTHALRGMVLGRQIIPSRAEGAFIIKADMQFTRYPASVTGPRAWTLRDNFTAYDASYVALAEYLDCPLVTTDGKMKRGARTIEVRLY